jgi:hypothetical protein
MVTPLDAQMNTAQELFDRYDSYKFASITSRRFTQGEMFGWLQPLLDRGQCVSSPVGSSAEGRTIRLVSFGDGPTKVLLWSQMHGDEPTATMALLDILNFFTLHPGNPVVEKIKKNLTLLMVPMINPDGAERFQRRTAQLIDLNRDALKLETAEARILKSIRDKYRPEFGFNLHDQDPRYTVGSTKNVTALALLAPAMDEPRLDNHVRRRAKLVAARLVDAMNQFIPGHIARYDDTFESRAFGDNIQKWGTSTVLIESGGWMGDREKMFIRKLNFVGILTSLNFIATGEYEKADLNSYEQLPLNSKNFYDMIFRNVVFQASARVPPVRLDVGVNLEEKRDSVTGELIFMGKIEDLGDLSTFGAFEDYDCGGILLDSGVIDMEKTLRREEFLSAMKKK